ncbi:MAG: 5'-nucleotidase, partial [Gordonibacter sp.]|uniref:5'-nucleotidase n=1 Tax=Gordonibacter sp. TaxID=1968902 RepID=UPI00321FD2AD
MKHPLPRKLLSLLVATVLALPLAASPLTGWAEEPGCPAAGSLPEQATASPGTPGEPAKPSDENAPTSNEEVDPGEQPANDGLLPRDGNPAEPADSTPSAQPSKPIVILHTNDAHCGVSETHDASGNATSIGYAGVAALLKQAAQTGTQLQSVGKIVIDPTNGTLTCNLVAPPVSQDADTLAYVKGIEDELNKVLGQKVAYTEVKLVAVENDARKNWAVRARETNLGDVCAVATRAALDTDIAFANGGGVRSDVAIDDITYGNAISVMPFGNSLCKIEPTGQTILDALEMGARLYPEPNGGFLQTSGLTYEIRSDIATPVKLDNRGNFIGVEGPRRVQNVRVARQPLDPASTYTLSAISYLLKEGGDGFTMFKG